MAISPIEELAESGELCTYCPIPEENQGVHNYGNGPVSCEGCNCKEAYENYLEENEED